jgi:hypothetical protein
MVEHKFKLENVHSMDLGEYLRITWNKSNPCRKVDDELLEAILGKSFRTQCTDRSLHPIERGFPSAKFWRQIKLFKPNNCDSRRFWEQYDGLHPFVLYCGCQPAKQLREQFTVKRSPKVDWPKISGSGRSEFRNYPRKCTPSPINNPPRPILQSARHLVLLLMTCKLKKRWNESQETVIYTHNAFEDHSRNIAR